MRLIDADALKAKFCNHCDERDCKPDATDTVYGCVIADTIDNMPTIETEPVKHGQWINTNNPNHLRCSNCDIIHMIAQYPNGKISYCPNCGVRMDGDSE